MLIPKIILGEGGGLGMQRTTSISAFGKNNQLLCSLRMNALNACTTFA